MAKHKYIDIQPGIRPNYYYLWLEILVRQLDFLLINKISLIKHIENKIFIANSNQGAQNH